MAQKVLFQTKLTELARSSDLGTPKLGDALANEMHVEGGKIYRFVKNVSATALVANGACLKALTSVLANVHKNVRSVDTTTAATAQLTLPGGVPVTAIAASGGTGTGDCGWVQIAGPARVSMVMSDTTAAASGWPGRMSICTNLPATAFWDVPDEVNSASDLQVHVHGVKLISQLRPGTASTGRSATVEVMCN